MKILVLRGGALGDLIVTIPALRALRFRFPNAELHLIGNLTAARLLVDCGILDEAYSQHEARWAGLYAAPPLSPATAEFLRQFDVIVSFWDDHDGTLARHLDAGPWRFVRSDPRVQSEPASRHFCTPLSALGITKSELIPRIEVSAAAKVLGQKALGENKVTIAVHVGSGSPKKSWPLERWRELCSGLNGRVLWITGEAENEEMQPPRSGHFVAARSWPLPTLAGALSQCVYYIGHDTGISHLAAALHLPCTLLFGPTDPRIWAPPGENIRILRKSSAITSLTVEHVLEALPKDLWLGPDTQALR